MSETDNGTGYRSPDDIQADIEQQREHLAETVDQLAHKLDVKAQGKAKVDDLKDRATTDDGKPRPEVDRRRGGGLRRVRRPRLVATPVMSSSSETAEDEKRTSPSMPEPDDSRKPDSPG